MQILLTNDDGIYAPGLKAMEEALRAVGEVCVVAPATEQSGVAHSITFLSPLICKAVFEGRGEKQRGWAVEGSPADCVKIGVFEFCPRRPDLIVSGINGGLNAGINVLYSGTVAAATEGAFFGITSIAVSLEYDEQAQFETAAHIAVGLIEQLLAQAARSKTIQHQYSDRGHSRARRGPHGPHGTGTLRPEFFEAARSQGRTYYWASGEPPPAISAVETDLTALKQGHITVTPLGYDRTQRDDLGQMQSWRLRSPTCP